MCDYEIIEKNRACVITRDAAKVRCYNDGEEMLYCIRDLFTVCKLNSVDSAMKAIARAADADPKAKLTLVWFPFCSPRAGWRTTKMYFANEYTFRMYMRGRYIPKEVKAWLVEDVFTFKADMLDDGGDCKQFGLNEPLPDTKHESDNSERILELKELLGKNGAAKLTRSLDANIEGLDDAVDKMILAMLDVMKLLVVNRSASTQMTDAEKVAS